MDNSMHMLDFFPKQYNKMGHSYDLAILPQRMKRMSRHAPHPG